MNASNHKGSTRTKLPLTAFIWPIAGMAISGYHIYSGTRSVGSFVVNIVVFVLSLALLALFTLARLVTGRDPASRIAVQQQQLFGGLHTYRRAIDADFKGLDRAFYDAASLDLVTNGFRPMGDFVDVTASKSWPRHRCVLRRFLSKDGTTMAAVYHLKLLGAISILQLMSAVSRKLKIYECETELTDGTFVNTSNDATANRTSGYPFVDRLQFDPGTPIAEIIQRHRERIPVVIATKDAGTMPVLIRTATEYQASQDRLQLLKSAHRRSPNFDFRAEVESIRGHELSRRERDFADEVAAQLQDAPPSEQAKGNHTDNPKS